MIIVLPEKINWKNPPILTLLIIFINCFIFFVFQWNDNSREEAAWDYYIESGLADIEIAEFFQYQTDVPNGLASKFNADEVEYETYYHAIYLMRRDETFLPKLIKEEIITNQDPVYAEWKELRADFEEKRSEIVTWKYGFKPYSHEPVTIFTSMFLHGDMGHLIGNMIFLWLVACMLEIGSGRLLFTGIYLIGGCCAVGLFWIINASSTVNLVGASGAISALMGAFTVIYGKKKVKAFLMLGFFFDFRRIPAIIILPFWIGYEFYKSYFNEGSNVAYMAHAGGLIGGALIGFIGSKFGNVKKRAAEQVEEAPKDEIRPIMEKALEQMGALKLADARKTLLQVLLKEPGNINALTHLFNIDKTTPNNPNIHDTASQLLSALRTDIDSHEQTYRIFKEYKSLVKRPRLTPVMYLQLIPAFIGEGHITEAARIISTLLKKMPDLPGMPTALLLLANAYKQKGMTAQWKQCRKIILVKYPDSPEARL